MWAVRVTGIQPSYRAASIGCWAALVIAGIALPSAAEAQLPPAKNPSADVRHSSDAPAPTPPADAGPGTGSESLPAATQAPAPQVPPWIQQVDAVFGRWLVRPLAAVLFFDFWTGKWLGEKQSVPLVVLWLFIGAVFCTLRMNFINLRAFWHAIRLTKGDYDDPNDPGEVSHFQALASALSATVGLGNIAGVAIAVAQGGPGAIFWLIVAGFLGMSSKFAECSLGQMYREVDRDGVVSGGPMRYLRTGLKQLGWRRLGPALAVLFAVMCMGGSFGGGCAFQVGQSLNALRGQIPFLDHYPWVYGLLMAAMTGVVIIGGIRRIAATAEKIVPVMCGLYIVASLYILATNAAHIPQAFGEIVRGAFTPSAAYGGFLGVMVIGIRRAAFSNEAGVGSASIAHSAAKTDEPISEGIVALLEPFIDTVVICTMTGLVIVITGVCNEPSNASLVAGNAGAQLTSLAFGKAVWWFPWILCAVVFMFAYSTMISWSYYGERCWAYLFGARTSLVYKFLFLGFVFLGSIVTAGNILDFSDLMILSMSLPNLLGVMLLSGKVRGALDVYWQRYQRGEMPTTRHHS
ncbi:MAG: alanine:cation symporter family protein [Planctomycetaceae bacterium]|nr:alanine:cation symporter family protein [Planctomycetaceae bacterium]